MAIAPTRFSRVSVGFVDSVNSIADKDPGDTGAVFSVTGPYAFTGAFTQTGDVTLSGSGSDLSVGGTAWVGGASTFNGDMTVAGSGSDISVGGTAWVGGTLTQIGAATLSSTLSAGGNVTATAGLFVGSAVAVNEVVAISSSTAAISFGAVAPNESSSVQTFGLSGLTRGDTLLVTVDSIYQDVAANRDVSFFASSSSTAGEGNIWAVNSTLTSVTPTAATVFRFTRINHPSYL